MSKENKTTPPLPHASPIDRERQEEIDVKNELKTLNAQNDYSIALAEQNHKAALAISKQLAYIFTAIVWGAFIIGSLALIFWAWHFLTPYNYHWLSPDQIQKIEGIMLSAAVGALVSNMGRKFI